MILALCLLAGAAVTGWLVPGCLRKFDLRRLDPVLLIVCWLLSGLGVFFAAVAGVVLLFLPAHGSFGPLLAEMINSSWRFIPHGPSPGAEEAGGTLGAAALLALAIRLAVVGGRGVRRRARARREHLATLRLAARSDGEVPATLWLAHDRPLAFSMGGRSGVVVATEGLKRHLDHDAVAAVLVHERAHLSGRHHQLVALADALRAAFPFLPLFRQTPRAIRELVELAADVPATRRLGTGPVRSALIGVSDGETPPSALAMARGAVDLRLARLDRDSLPPVGFRRAMTCGAAGLTAVIVPFLASTAFVVSVVSIAWTLTSA